MKALALFDFDGTITTKDSATEFFRFLYKNRIIYLYKHYFLCLFEIVKFKFLGYSYLILKNKRLSVHIDGLAEMEFKQHCTNFDENIIQDLIKQSALQTIDQHKKAGDAVWIVSASYDFLIGNWCRRNGLSYLVNTTKLENGKITLTSEECNFNGKVVRILENIELSTIENIYAYGDSAGDEDMLALANNKFYKYFN